MDITRDATAGGTTMMLVYFAWVREKIGRPSDEIDIPNGVKTVADLVAHLRTRGAEYEQAFARPELVRVAIDHVHARPDSLIGSAREIAFFPPVTGG